MSATAIRRKRKPITPIERAAAPPQPDSPGAPPVAEPDGLSEDLVYQRERAYAVCMALRFERWLLEHIADRGIPLDNCLRAVTLLPIYVEARLKAAILWPWYFLASDEGERPQEMLAWEDVVQDEADARVYGLTVRRGGGGRKGTATLPGCHGVTLAGAWCANLREYGEKFCPSCRRKELRRLRLASL